MNSCFTFLFIVSMAITMNEINASSVDIWNEM